LNPDWVNVNGQKKVIELFGEMYHDPSRAKWKIPYRQTAPGRRRTFGKFGFSTLIVWSREVYSLTRSSELPGRLIERIRRFNEDRRY
jgi:hypothetical protein